MDNTGLSALRVEDFSGGMTDFYLGASPNKAQSYDNFVLNEKNDIITRPGAELKFDLRLSASGTIQNIIDNQNEILIQANKSILYVDDSGVHEVKSPTLSDVFEGANDSIRANFTYWNKHTLGTSDHLTWHPQKLYKDENGEWRVTNLGLPSVTYTMALSLAEILADKYLDHIADDDPHLVPDTVNGFDLDAPKTFDELVTFVTTLKEKLQDHLNDVDNVTPTYHSVTGALVTLESSNLDTITEIYNYLKKLTVIFNTHDANDTIHGVASLYPVPSFRSEISVDGGSGENSYIYGIQYAHRYKVEDLEFLERGPIHLVEIEDCASVTGGIDIDYIPKVSGENFDEEAITKIIYRTVNNGSVLYLNKELPYNEVDYTDTLSDDDLQLQPTAYTEGGVLDDERPPPSKYIKTINDITYFGGVREGKYFRGNKLKSSKPGAPYSSPGQFYLEFEDDITGLGAVGTYPVVFLNRAMYRIDGFFESSGRGGMTKRSISQRTGCVSHDSIVTTKNGAYFAAEDGFYFTDANTCIKISPDINLTYKDLVDKDKIQGTYDPLRNRILWSVKTDGNSPSQDKLFVAFLDYKTELGGHPFFTWSGGLDADNFSASSLNYINGELLRADHRGYLLKHDESLLSDVHINPSFSPENFFTQTLFYDYRGAAFDFGNAQTRKWVSKINVNADNKTSLSLGIKTSNDNSGEFVELKPITTRLSVDWGEDSIIWQESDMRWKYNPVISAWRWMNSRQNLRCMYKQVQFLNHYTEISNSETFGACSGDQVLKTVTLTTSDEVWSPDIVNYNISFDTDSYEKEFKIVNQAGNTITVEDDENLLPELTSSEWKIKGYPKREVFNLLNYVLNFRTISMTQDAYRGGDD